MPERPSTESTFTDTMQIGIVVSDLDAAICTYRDVYGIGPGEVFEVGPENSHDVRLYGQPVEWRGRAAMTMVGGVMWELIQPLDDNGLFARFLAERGGGVHHIAVATPDFRRTLKEQAARGNELILSGTFSGIEVDFLSTERDLGVIVADLVRRRDRGHY
jgi:methylmalonyl-CoA/ethylmalonyl-CoA epimerase